MQETTLTANLISESSTGEDSEFLGRSLGLARQAIQSEGSAPEGHSGRNLSATTLSSSELLSSTFLWTDVTSHHLK